MVPLITAIWHYLFIEYLRPYFIKDARNLSQIARFLASLLMSGKFVFSQRNKQENSKSNNGPDERDSGINISDNKQGWDVT
jgi:hypothetical protein